MGWTMKGIDTKPIPTVNNFLGVGGSFGTFLCR